MLRRFIFLSYLLFSSFLFGDDVVGNKSLDKLVVGTTFYAPPLEMVANGKTIFTGFDIDLMNEVCRRMNRTCSFQAYTFEQLFPAVLDGTIDVAIAGITITKQRSEKFLFSLPYLASSGQFMTKTTSPLKTIENLNGKRVGIERGTLFKELALQTLDANTSVVEYKDQSIQIQALGNDEIDAVLLDTATADYWVANNGNLFKLIGKNIIVGSGYGIMTSKNNTALINDINSALLSTENDGIYLRLYNMYF